MKGFSLVLMCCLLLGQLLQASDAAPGRVDWLRNYDEAVQKAQRESKPIVMFFTGSDWCGWCTKLEKEALDTPEFAQLAGPRFVFLLLDFPIYKAQDPTLSQQNRDLQKKYEVRGFPTLVIIDSKQKRIGTTGYRPGGGKQYAEHLIKMVDDFQGYQQRAATLDQGSQKGQDLKRLYEKASEYQLKDDMNKIVQLGLQSDHSQYFLTEQYRLLVSEGHINDQQAVVLRQQLLQNDPNNQLWTHYKVALIDFEAYNEDLEKGQISPEKALEPLISYINTFQKQDSENIWRLQLIVSQVLYGHKDFSKALKYAEDSYTTAPSSARPDINKAIENIKIKLATR